MISIECKSDRIKINGKTYPCTVSMALDLIGGKWKIVILYHLISNEKRYSELFREMDGITERTLSLQLKELEKDGLVFRTSTGSKPPIKVTYGLTSFGITVIPILQAILQWGNQIALDKAEFI